MLSEAFVAAGLARGGYNTMRAAGEPPLPPRLSISRDDPSKSIRMTLLFEPTQGTDSDRALDANEGGGGEPRFSGELGTNDHGMHQARYQRGKERHSQMAFGTHGPMVSQVRPPADGSNRC